MAVWAFDGWPILRWVFEGLPGLDQLRTAPGYGVDRTYDYTQQFYDDDLHQTITGDLLKTRVPVLNLDSFAKLPYGPFPAVQVQDVLPQVGFKIEETRYYTPAPVPVPRIDVNQLPDPGDVLIATTHGYQAPPAKFSTPAGGLVVENSYAADVTPVADIPNEVRNQITSIESGTSFLLNEIPQDLTARLTALSSQLGALDNQQTNTLLPIVRSIAAQIATLKPGDTSGLAAQLTTVLGDVQQLLARPVVDPTAQLNALATSIARIQPGLTAAQEAQLTDVQNRLAALPQTDAQQLSDAVATLYRELGDLSHGLNNDRAAQITAVQNQLTALQSATGTELAGAVSQLGSQLQTVASGLGANLSAELGVIQGQIAQLNYASPADVAGIASNLYQRISDLVHGLNADRAQQIGAIGNLVSDVHGTLDQMAGSLQTKLDAQATQITNRIQTVADNVTQQIAAEASSVTSSIAGVEKDLTSQINAELGTVTQAVNSASATIVAQLGADVQQVDNTLSSVTSAAADELAAAIGKIGQGLPTVDDVLTKAASAVFSFGTAAWPSWLEPLKALTEHAVRGTLDSLEADAVQLLGDALGQVVSMPETPPLVRSLARQLQAPQHAVVLLLLVPVLLEAAHEILRVPLEEPVEWWRQALRRFTPLEIPGLPESAALRARGLLDVQEARYLAASKGYENRWADLTAELERELLSPAETIAAWLRGYLTEGAAVDQLTRRGFNDADSRILMRLATEVPSPGDLVTFMRREVFTPQISEPYGHFAEYPAGATPWFAKVGFDEQVAQLYWAAHWDVPSVTQFFEMFQRGIINPDQLNLGLRAANVVPGWRGALTQLAYHPLTRVDVRRMYQLGVLDEAQVTTAYQHVGYSPEDAQRLTRFTVEYAKHSARTEEATFRNPIRTRLLTAFMAGELSQAETQAALVELGYTDADTGPFFAEAGYLATAQTRGRVRDALHRLFVDGDLTEGEVRQRLAAAGVPSTSIDALLTGWGYEQELHVDQDQRRHHHELSRAEVVESYRDGLVTREQAAAELQDAGYTAAAADTLLKLEDRRAERLQLKDDVEAVHAQYVHGILTRADASAQLDALVASSRSRQAYLARWDAERAKPQARLSTTELKSLYVRGQITSADARLQLVALNLAPVDVDHLLTLWDVDRQRTLANLTDAELKKLLAASLITDAEVRGVLQLRGLSAENASRLASVVGG